MREDTVSFTPDKNFPFRVIMCGISYCDGNYKIIRPNSELNNIEYILSGTGTVNENGNIFHPSAGDVFFLKRGNDQLYYSDSDSPWVKIWMNFSGTFADKITESYNLKSKPYFHAPELKKYFFKIYNLAHSDIGIKSICDNAAIIFLKLAQKLYLLCESDSQPPNIARDTKQYIDNMTDFSYTLDDISAELSYSKNHIIRCFKEDFGITPYKYILNRRFTLAEALLKNTACSISEISEKLGFCDARYFANSFKKQYGLSPLQYRKELKNRTNISHV